MKGKSAYRWGFGVLVYLLMVLAVSQLPGLHTNQAPAPSVWPESSSNPWVGNWQGSWGGELAVMLKRNVDVRLVVSPGEEGGVASDAFLSLAPNSSMGRASSVMTAEAHTIEDGATLQILDESGGRYLFERSGDQIIGKYTSKGGETGIVKLFQAKEGEGKVVGDTGGARVTVGSLIVDDFGVYLMYLVLWDSVMQSLMYFLGCALGFVIFYRVFRRYFEKRKIQSRMPDWSQFKYEIGYSVAAMLIFGWGTCVLHYGIYSEYVRFFDEPDAYGWPYYFLSIALIFILHDTYFYWGHRAMHVRKLYPYFHRGHHRSSSPTPWAAWAFPPLEGVVQAAFVPIVILILPMHFSVLIIFFVGNLVRSIIGHSGHEIYPRVTVTSKWFSWIATVTHHDMHHQYFNYNYAIYFTWWDKLMGTEHPEYVEHVKAVLDKK